jgi:hypothetical protein
MPRTPQQQNTPTKKDTPQIVLFRTCKRCGNEFRPLNGKHTHYCSRECSNQKTIARCTCAGCGTVFKARHIRKYCAPSCDPSRQQLNLPERICSACSCNYKPRYKAQKYCSRSCSKYTPHKPSEHKGFYQSKEWKQIRTEFIASSTTVRGLSISNRFCIECYKKHNRLNDMYAVDHIIRLKDGGDHSFSNLQSLCQHHHQSKSAVEGNKERYERANT